MPTATETVQLTATRVVGAGEVFDGGNRRYNLSGGGQGEGQPAVFDVQDGGTIGNVIIGTLAADGIHCLGNCMERPVAHYRVDTSTAGAMTARYVRCPAHSLSRPMMQAGLLHGVFDDCS